MSLTASILDGVLGITVDLQKPKASSSGKSRVIVLTGLKKTEAKFEGKSVFVSVTALVFRDEYQGFRKTPRDPDSIPPP